MSLKKESERLTSLESVGLVHRENGVLYINVKTVKSVNFKHYFAEVYAAADATSTTSFEEVKGLCEWVSCTVPVLSIGWDWKYTEGGLVVDGEPYTNFVFVDEKNCSIEEEGQNKTLMKLIDMLEWDKLLTLDSNGRKSKMIH
jgi:hypothetical protein